MLSASNIAMERVTLDHIQAARRRIGESVYLTPCPQSHGLSELLGGPVYLKLENLQKTGSYKERGALNKLLTLSPEECTRGLVTASAGNHAQSLAYHATRLGLNARIWMPLTTPLVKVAASRQYGAEVILHGMNFDESFLAASQYSRAHGCTFIHPFDDHGVIAGQGTLALELLEQVSSLQVVVVPVGGGGLISGMAVALKELNPAIQVLGVQSSAFPSMVHAVQKARPVTLQPTTTTIADGIAVRRAGEKTLPLIQRYVDDLLVVDEDEIANAVLFLLERQKTLAEGAGATALAALLHHKVKCDGKVTVLIVSGGNMDVTLLARIIERGLVKDGRLLRLRVSLPDHPGALHRLTEVIASHQGNIVETSYHRAFHGASVGETVIDLTMETRGCSHSDAMTTALANSGYSHQRIV